MEEYASMRLTLFWSRAPTLPSVMDNTAETQISHSQALLVVSMAPNRMRSSTAKAAAFGPVDIKPTMGAGEPSYTSGVQMWNGAEATLNPMPTNINAIAK